MISPPPDLDFRLAQREAKIGATPMMYQRRSAELFLHWSCGAEVIQRTLPPGLTADTHDGRAWIGLVPFRMSGIRPRGLPSAPWISAFPEMNVRTYAFDEAGRPGVWFYSLDAARWLAVKFARGAFHLPYFHAEMKIHRDPDSGWIDYHSRRRDNRAEAWFRYRGKGETAEAEPGSLEFFLLERYLLFAPGGDRDGLRRGFVSHQPYRYRSAEVPLFGTPPITAAGLPQMSGLPDHAAFVERVDVSIFNLEREKA